MTETHAWRSFRHWLVRATAKRAAHTCTNFVRVPNQFEGLVGPVVDSLAPAGVDRPLEITVMGCSIGAEPYTIASWLVHRRPDLRFRIRATDIDPKLVERGRLGRYDAQEVLDHVGVDNSFVRETFLVEGQTHIVKPEIARHVTFEVADLLDDNLPERFGQADIVFAQNLLFHFTTKQATAAFHTLHSLMRPRAALFIDGMDVPLRTSLTRQYGLTPLDYRIREIHEDARVLRGVSWPWYYWGLEPFDPNHADLVRHYATIFLGGG